MKQTEAIIYPSIVVDIGDNLFSVNSSQIDGILQLNGYRKLPDVPAEIRGIFQNRNKAVVLVDMRIAFNMDSLEQKYTDFCHMIDDRKQDHIRWVNALEQTIRSNEPFTLATDSHKCALGKWVDQFHSDIGEVNFQLRKLDPPHASLHHSAVEIINMMAEDASVHKDEISRIFIQVKEKYMPAVLTILEEMKEIFHTSVFREMVLLINGRTELGIIVDKVLSVEELTSVNHGNSQFNTFLDIPYIKNVQQSEKMPGLILEIDLDTLLSRIGKLHLPQL